MSRRFFFLSLSFLLPATETNLETLHLEDSTTSADVRIRTTNQLWSWVGWPLNGWATAVMGRILAFNRILNLSLIMQVAEGFKFSSYHPPYFISEWRPTLVSYQIRILALKNKKKNTTYTLPYFDGKEKSHNALLQVPNFSLKYFIQECKIPSCSFSLFRPKGQLCRVSWRKTWDCTN